MSGERKWLLRELPRLREEGVLSEYYAEALREYYESGEGAREPGARLTPVLLFSILGALLVGGGVILVLGHNWSELSRGVRTVLALLPLMVTQAVGGWVLLRRGASLVWRETVATLNVLMVASSIALIGQTYHIPGSMEGFLLTWLLLMIPVIYCFRALTPGLVYLMALIGWLGAAGGDHLSLLPFWGLYVAVLPFFAREILGRESGRGELAAVGLGLQALWLALLLRGAPDMFWIPVYSGLFVLLALPATLGLAGNFRLWGVMGRLGAGVVVLMLSYEWAWDESGSLLRVSRVAGGLPELLIHMVGVGLLPVGALILWVRSWRRGCPADWLFGALPCVSVIGVLGTWWLGEGWFAVILLNLYVLVLGILYMLSGIRTQALRVLNGGMLLLAVWLVLRFFDSDVPMVFRGVFFILLGLGFWGTNVVMLRKRGGGR